MRFWLNLNYKNELDGVPWEQRLFVVVWMALTALALGEDVLVHCRQGKHRSGVVVMMLMTILAVAGSEDLSGRGLLGFTILGWMGMLVEFAVLLMPYNAGL